MPFALPKLARISRNVRGVLLEDFQRDDLERGFVGGGEHNGAGRALEVGLQPADRDHAPPVSRGEAGELPLGVWRDQVVADVELMLEELAGDDRADRVAAGVLRAGGAAAVAVEAGD